MSQLKTLRQSLLFKLRRYKAYQAYWLDIQSNRLYLGNNSPVVIWQMGKVGSTSIYESLKKKKVKPLFHFHSLRRPGTTLSPNFGQAPIHICKHLEKQLPIKIITLVREPIGRNISSFFQRFSGYTGLKSYQAAQLSSSELQLLFMTKFYHQEPLIWFDQNFKKYLNLDLYQYDFPQEQGFYTIKQDNIEVLILKVELEDSLKEKAIANFLELDSFCLVNHNIASNKGYFSAYKLLKENLTIPKKYLEAMKTSQYFNHFYTEEEIDCVIQHWQKKLSQ